MQMEMEFEDGFFGVVQPNHATVGIESRQKINVFTTLHSQVATVSRSLNTKKMVATAKNCCQTLLEFLISLFYYFIPNFPRRGPTRFRPPGVGAPKRHLRAGGVQGSQCRKQNILICNNHYVKLYIGNSKYFHIRHLVTCKRYLQYC